MVYATPHQALVKGEDVRLYMGKRVPKSRDQRRLRTVRAIKGFSGSSKGPRARVRGTGLAAVSREKKKMGFFRGEKKSAVSREGKKASGFGAEEGGGRRRRGRPGGGSVKRGQGGWVFATNPFCQKTEGNGGCSGKEKKAVRSQKDTGRPRQHQRKTYFDTIRGGRRDILIVKKS